MKKTYTCPKCDGTLDGIDMKPWGQPGSPPMRIAPFVCTLCGSLMVYDLLYRVIWTNEELLGWLKIDAIGEMKKNAVMWKTISEAREKILANPERRPVLR